VFQRPAFARSEADAAKKRFAHVDGDHLTLLNVYHAFKQQEGSGANLENWCYNNFLNLRSLKSADNVRTQLKRLMERYELDTNLKNSFDDKVTYYNSIRRCLVNGFFMQVSCSLVSVTSSRTDTLQIAYKKDKGYMTIKDDQVVSVHPSSVLSTEPEWILYNEFVLTTRNYVRTVTDVKGQWLVDPEGWVGKSGYFDPSTFRPGPAKKAIEKALAKASKKKRA